MNNPISQDFNRLANAIRRLPPRVATVAQNFSKIRFREQAWKDQILQPWSKRKNEKESDKGRAILIKTARLSRSIKARATGMTIIVMTDIPYAQAHNEGFKGIVTDAVNPFSRKGHLRKGYMRKDVKQIKATQVREHTVGQFTRKRNMNLPKRQFLGQSAALDKEIEKLITSTINASLK